MYTRECIRAPTVEGLSLRKRATSVNLEGWRGSVRMISEEAEFLLQADNMGQQLQRQGDPEATRVPLKITVNVLLRAGRV